MSICLLPLCMTVHTLFRTLRGFILQPIPIHREIADAELVQYSQGMFVARKDASFSSAFISQIVG